MTPRGLVNLPTFSRPTNTPGNLNYRTVIQNQKNYNKRRKMKGYSPSSPREVRFTTKPNTVKYLPPNNKASKKTNTVKESMKIAYKRKERLLFKILNDKTTRGRGININGIVTFAQTAHHPRNRFNKTWVTGWLRSHKNDTLNKWKFKMNTQNNGSMIRRK